jgi:hypothetical protein
MMLGATLDRPARGCDAPFRLMFPACGVGGSVGHRVILAGQGRLGDYSHTRLGTPASRSCTRSYR